MMKDEFEKLAGYEVTLDDFQKIIEPMYMATALDKSEFVKCLNRRRFALPTKEQMIGEMRKTARHLHEICGRFEDYKILDKLESMANAYARRFYNLDLLYDPEAWVYFNTGYEFPDLQRGCTYPRELVIGRGEKEFERIRLVTDC